ncbi:response regulator [Candidatus Poriferisodalis sp.]|uniref:response regulator n=1 Tax=Candidatus Poriferisodalis sp. TaxID=3101277 RepID=UPI003B02CAA6
MRSRSASTVAGVTDGRCRVVIVDDHHLFRSGVRAELGEAVEVVADAGDVADAVAAIERYRPDVVLLDVHLPSGSGCEVIEAVADAGVSTRFLALSVSDAAQDVIGAVRAGARGYVTKSISGADLAAAIARVRAGDAVFSPRLAGFVLDAFAADAADGSAGSASDARDPVDADGAEDLHRLTAREREVMRHLARGYLYKEIAYQLGISVKTVESHASAVLRKLQLTNRHQLSRWAAARRIW